MSTQTDEMRVIKRNGQIEIVSFDKILQRIKNIGNKASIKINYTQLAMKVIDQLYDKITTTQIDTLTADQCASMSSIHYDYGTLAAHIVISNHHKNTSADFAQVVKQLYFFQDKHGKNSPLVSDQLYETVINNADLINYQLDFDRDYLFDYFGFKTLEKTYLMRLNGKIVERPQHMWMRVSLGIHGDDLQAAFETYHLMSKKYFTHATPTLFNSGTPRPQLSSCFLLSMENDSIDGIYSTLKDCALISKWAGGIGLHIHNIRASGSHIRGTNGNSNGIVPMLRVFNNTAKYVDQCVTPETIIYTTKGPIQIKNCISGETEIFNLKGEKEIIQNVLEHSYEGNILNINTMHSICPLKITGEHPVYVIQNQPRGLNYSVIKNRLEKQIVKPEWIEANKLTKDDLIVYSIPRYVNDIETISADDCYMYGILLGDGYMNSKLLNGHITLHSTQKTHILNFAIQYFKNTYTEYKINTEGLTTKIRWNRNLNMPFKHSDLYDETGCKHILPKWLNLPIEKAQYILKGLIETDGCIREEIVFDSTSYKLIEGARFICLKMGILTSGYVRNRIGQTHNLSRGGTITNKKTSYVLRIPKTKEICNLFNIQATKNHFFKFMKYENLLFTRIHSISSENYSGALYDLQLVNEHNYLIHNGLVHNGGGKRHGSFAIYLEPWHADIELFLEMRKNHGDEELKARDLFYALWIPDLFMERVKSDGQWTLMCPDECPGLADVYGDDFVTLYTSYETEGKGRKTVKARDLWFKVLDAQMETGTPYLCYKDAANKKSNQKNIGTIKSSNLCVAPETLVLTDAGHKQISSIVGQTVNVWNGEEFSEVNVVKTGENQKLIEIHTNDNLVLSCTPYHKFYIQTKYSKSLIQCVNANELKIGNKLIKCKYPCIDGTDTMLYPYTHGFFCGDGTYSNVNDDAAKTRCSYKSINNHYYCKRHINYETEYANFNNLCNDGRCNGICYDKKPIIYLYGEKKLLLDKLTYNSCSENNNRKVLCLPLDIEEKFFVPTNCNLLTKMQWFSGYCDADGTISVNNKNKQLQVSSINLDFLKKIKLMLQTCGINPKLSLSKSEGTSLLPNGHGNKQLYATQAVYRLLITSIDLCKLISIGFSPNRLNIITEIEPNRNASQFIKINNIIDNGRYDDTYCFTEPKRGMAVFNGILTGQCSEIIEYSDDKETAVCNLASMGLPTFVDPKTKTFDYAKLAEVTQVVTRNLNKVIDINYYPTEKTRTSNMRHRPIGIGVQGLADVFMLMDIPFHSEEAKRINQTIFETIYYGALKASNELAFLKGKYETFFGSPASEGLLQYDLWGKTTDDLLTKNMFDWTSLKEYIQSYGLRNSLLLAPMPTASTSQILGFNECFEPFTSNIYSRRTLAGEFVLTNKYLMRDLIAAGLWSKDLKNSIIANQGSVQHIEGLSQHLKNKYKTVWEIPMRHVIDMAADRGAFICQSQSLNLWMEDPNYNALTSMHFYAWSKGLKTGIYYLRRRAKHRAQQFTIEPEKQASANEECTMCSA